MMNKRGAVKIGEIACAIILTELLATLYKVDKKTIQNRFYKLSLSPKSINDVCEYLRFNPLKK